MYWLPLYCSNKDYLTNHKASGFLSPKRQYQRLSLRGQDQQL